MMIAEEPTEENIKQLIDSIPPDITALERLLLCNYGTVQTLLSVMHKTPVKVQVLSQMDLGDVIIRWARLMTNEITVCLAESIIPKNSNPPGFLTAVEERKFGIGQIIKTCGLRTERVIIGLYRDENIIARNYKICGDVSVLITETFSRVAIWQAQ